MLRIYPVCLEMVREVRPYADRIARFDRDLARQLRRSCTAVPLNVAEGSGLRGGLQSYLGLVPGERSSGDTKHRTSLTKAGSAYVRRVLVQAAWVAWRCRKGDPMVRWARQIAQRRGNHVAVVALARKMAIILYAIWRDQSHYDPSRGAQWVDADGVVHSPSARS
jgi:Transposase IS116/IS110/IS902 family